MSRCIIEVLSVNKYMELLNINEEDATILFNVLHSNQIAVDFIKEAILDGDDFKDTLRRVLNDTKKGSVSNG